MRILMTETRVEAGQEFLAGHIYILPEDLQAKFLQENAGRDADAPAPEPPPPAPQEPETGGDA